MASSYCDLSMRTYGITLQRAKDIKLIHSASRIHYVIYDWH